jgi:glycine cleavage system H lipoate-binding protein/TusA-related sulfurtransferase
MKIEGCPFPEEFLYSHDGTLWFSHAASGLKIGLSSLFVWSFGRVNTVRFREIGSKVGRGKSLGWIEGPTNFNSVRIEFDCRVVEYNKKLLEEPSLLNKAYYGEGWFAIVVPEGEYRLFEAPEIEKEIFSKIKELRVICFSAFPDIEMYEIGVECSAVLTKLNDTLSSYPQGTVIHIVSDDPAADIEMERWSISTGNKILEKRIEDGLMHFLVGKV